MSVCSCKSFYCKCRANYLAVIKIIEIDKECIFTSNDNELVKPSLHNVLSGQLTSEFVAIPVEDIVDLCTYINFGDRQSKVFLALRPNKMEGD